MEVSPNNVYYLLYFCLSAKKHIETYISCHPEKIRKEISLVYLLLRLFLCPHCNSTVIMAEDTNSCNSYLLFLFLTYDRVCHLCRFSHFSWPWIPTFGNDWTNMLSSPPILLVSMFRIIYVLHGSALVLR